MHHGTYVTHVPWCMRGSLTSGFIWSRWQGKLSRYSWRMRNPQFYVSGKRPILTWHPHLLSRPVPGDDKCEGGHSSTSVMPPGRWREWPTWIARQQKWIVGVTIKGSSQISAKSFHELRTQSDLDDAKSWWERWWCTVGASRDPMPTTMQIMLSSELSFLFLYFHG